MIAKKIVFFVFISLFLTYPAKSVLAEATHCGSVTVVRAGVNSGGIMVQLQNTNTSSACGDWPLNTSRFFYLDNTNKQANAMLATALMAQSTGATILVQTITNKYIHWSTIKTLYINNQ